jgi:hypothetical protein
MVTQEDAPGVWATAGLAGLCLAVVVWRVKFPAHGGYPAVTRKGEPVSFWFLVALMGAFVFVLVFLALMASVPWPPPI